MSSIPRNRLVPLIVGGVAALAIVIGAGFWWTDKQSFEKTDNAFIQADTVQVSPQVAGYVVEVLVTDNQHVEAGQVLARIDTAATASAAALTAAPAAAVAASAPAAASRVWWRSLTGSWKTVMACISTKQ